MTKNKNADKDIVEEQGSKSGFDEELFLQIAKEMVIEVAEGPGRDMINGEEVDVMDIIFGKDSPFYRKQD